MKSAQLAAYEGVCLLAFALSMTDVVSAASPELSDEEKIELIKQGDWQTLGLIPQPPRAPETDEEKLAAIRGQRDGSLEIAREMLARELPATRIEALNAMSNYDSREALDFLREYVVRTDRLDRTRFNAQARWAGTFRNRFGEQADGLAIHAIEDPAVDDLDRALHLMVLLNSERDLALSFYRPYLESPSPEVRYAALMVNSAHWDYTVLPILLDLENGTDPLVRSQARTLSRRYLRWGDARPPKGGSVLSPSFRAAHPQPYDPEGLRAGPAVREVESSSDRYLHYSSADP